MRRLLMPLLAILSILTACSHKAVQPAAEPWLDFNKEEVWMLTAIRQKTVHYADGQQPATLQINPEAGTYSGSAGCNGYFGQYEASNVGRTTDDGQHHLRGFRFSEAGVTKMMCPDNEMKIEEKFLPTLSKVTDYDITRYTLTFYQKDREVLRFEKR